MSSSPVLLWRYFPASHQPPEWSEGVAECFRFAMPAIDSATFRAKSDDVLKAVRLGLTDLGFRVEAGKKQTDRLPVGVLYGEGGKAARTVEVDAWHPELGVVVEVEAGRAIHNAAIYRDIVNSSLIEGARGLVMAVPRWYSYTTGGRNVVSNPYAETVDLLTAIFASERLRLPFEGVQVVGY